MAGLALAGGLAAPVPVRAEAPVALPVVAAVIELRGIGFAYDDDPPSSTAST